VIKPLLNTELVEFIGEIGYPDKCEFLGNAAALIFPIDWPEPFGLVMIEAMASGTPVIAYPSGSVSEIVEHGVSGFLVGGIEEACDAIKHVAEINRLGCRMAFEERFSARRMARDYVTIYERLIGGEPEPLALSDGVSVG
jgi:glycosyltransferase involved in cell wall biosynthesis